MKSLEYSTLTRNRIAAIALMAGAMAIAPMAGADEAAPVDHSTMDHSKMDHSRMDHAAMGHEGHEGHDMSAMQEVKLSQGEYKLPDVTMTSQDGARLPIAKMLNDGRPVVLNFIYTSCTAICPVTSQVFSDFREKLGDKRKGVNMVSISIDPDYDTPQRLNEYSAHYGADANWKFYTGSLHDSVAVQKAFATYRGDKMNHAPVTFMRAAQGKPWVRVEGFAGPDKLLAEYRKITGKS
jgi:protein SCO1/2